MLAAARLRFSVSSDVAALPSTKAAKPSNLPSSLSARRPVLPEEDRRRAFGPVALMGTTLTGVVCPAWEGLISAMLKVVLLSSVSICKTAKLPGVNGTGGTPMLNRDELVIVTGA